MSTPAPVSQRPSLAMRLKSSLIMGMTGVVSRCFLYGFNSVEVAGLAKFIELLDSRKDAAKRQRGLLTVSNHVSVLDDPVVWGVLPLKYAFNPSNLRWTLGAADICFKNKGFSAFFSHGQVLPCHRLKHSPFGGPFQPALTQAIRLLSSPPPAVAGPYPPTYTTTGADSHPSPLAYPLYRRHSWVHVFPEGLVHQHASTDLRYFKWGLARLILEADPAPDVLPMFIDGTQRIMPEDRTFPRFLPRVGRKVRVAFGDVVDYETTFGDLRARWERLVAREREREARAGVGAAGGEVGRGMVLLPGELPSEALKFGAEAQAIRIEVARRMRDEILKVRNAMGGFAEPDPSFALAETWAPDDGIEAKAYRSRVDGSNISQD
ncbi:acyltransferase-like protein [Trichocladium antarcticum]|uniref:Tafazzin family protein n=1 Tax=Trichocladium antarcticum TaxID=1450529 RepID=A0AAN6ZDQ4_9PEZI|nr:acyltransferase-like protein [Trichocladium antarcticum]